MLAFSPQVTGRSTAARIARGSTSREQTSRRKWAYYREESATGGLRTRNRYCAYLGTDFQWTCD